MCDLDGSNEQQLSNKNFIHSPVYNGEYVYYLLSENNEENDWEIYTQDGLPSAQWEIMVLVTEDGAEVLSW